MSALGDLAAPALVLTGPSTDPGVLPPDAVVVPLGAPVPDQKWASVVLAVADAAELRTVVSSLPSVGRARHVWCYLAGADRPLTTVLRPEWPPLGVLRAETTEAGGAVTRLSFRRPVPAHTVLAELARHAGTPVVTGHHGLVVTGIPVPVDPTVVTPEVPASVGAETPTDELGVLGRAPVAVDPGLGPLDEGVFNPVGFRRDWDRGPVPLPGGPVTAVLVASLRDAQAVVVGPGADARAIAALAMAGIPLIGPGAPDVDLDDPAAREEHSVRLRRAALREHSSLGWRQRVGAAAGVRTAAYLSVHDVRITVPDGLVCGPEVVDDLLLAQFYSGADRVTMPVEDTRSEYYGWVEGGPSLVAPARTGLDYVTHGLGVRKK